MPASVARFTPEQMSRLEECRTLSESLYVKADETQRKADQLRSTADALMAERFCILNGLRYP